MLLPLLLPLFLLLIALTVDAAIASAGTPAVAPAFTPAAATSAVAPAAPNQGGRYVNLGHEKLPIAIYCSHGRMSMQKVKPLPRERAYPRYVIQR